MEIRNRQWILKRRPKGLLRRDDLLLRRGAEQERPLADGEIRIRNLAFHHAPTMRNWMSGDESGLHRTIALGSPVTALAAGRVVESRASAYPVGARVTAMSKWSEYDIVDVRGWAPTPISPGTTAIEAMGILGINSLTAYFGLLRIGEPRSGETLVVSGAAGATGSVAAQIGRLQGCRVIGIAGGENKCNWLRNACGVDATIDYKSEDVGSALDRLCPEGIDIFYDNIGGAILQAGVDHMARHGRIVLCGQISGYNEEGPVAAFTDMMRLIYGSIRMQGFLFTDYAPEIPAAMEQLVGWIRSGAIVTRQDVREGFENLPSSFNALFDGTNEGVLVAMIDQDATSVD